MEAVYMNHEEPSVSCSIDLQGLPKERYNECYKLLKPAFQAVQIAVILEPFAQQGLFDDEYAMSGMTELCGQLCSFWNAKMWDEDMSAEFQTLILTRPELEGAKIVFMAHPAFSQLMGISDQREAREAHSSKMRFEEVTMRRGGLTLKPFDSPNNNNEKGKEEVSDSENMALSDEELIIIPRAKVTRIVPCELNKRKFKIYTNEVVDREEIEFISTEEHEGIMYVLVLEPNEYGTARVGLAFDLIHSVYSDDSCIVRVMSSVSGQYESEGWVKEIVVQAHVWTNVCEKLLPCNVNLFPIVFSIINLEPEGETPTIKVKGVRLSDHEKNRNIEYLRSDNFQPYDYGFCQNF